MSNAKEKRKEKKEQSKIAVCGLWASYNLEMRNEAKEQ